MNTRPDEIGASVRQETTPAVSVGDFLAAISFAYRALGALLPQLSKGCTPYTVERMAQGGLGHPHTPYHAGVRPETTPVVSVSGTRPGTHFT